MPTPTKPLKTTAGMWWWIVLILTRRRLPTHVINGTVKTEVLPRLVSTMRLESEAHDA